MCLGIWPTKSLTSLSLLFVEVVGDCGTGISITHTLLFSRTRSCYYTHKDTRKLDTHHYRAGAIRMRSGNACGDIYRHQLHTRAQPSSFLSREDAREVCQSRELTDRWMRLMTRRLGPKVRIEVIWVWLMIAFCRLTVNDDSSWMPRYIEVELSIRKVSSCPFIHSNIYLFAFVTPIVTQSLRLYSEICTLYYTENTGRSYTTRQPTAQDTRDDDTAALL